MRPSRTGGTVPPGNTTGPLPLVLAVDSGDNATWTWSGSDPVNWGFYLSTAVVPGAELETSTGSSRGAFIPALSSLIIVIRGLDSTGLIFVTPASNAVFVP